jgi:hypothetical protein
MLRNFIPKRAVSDLIWISKEIDTEKLKARLLIKDIGKKERRLLKRAIIRLEPKVLPAVIETAIPKKVRKPRVKKDTVV